MAVFSRNGGPCILPIGSDGLRLGLPVERLRFIGRSLKKRILVRVLSTCRQ